MAYQGGEPPGDRICAMEPGLVASPRLSLKRQYQGAVAIQASEPLPAADQQARQHIAAFNGGAFRSNNHQLESGARLLNRLDQKACQHIPGFEATTFQPNIDQFDYGARLWCKPSLGTLSRSAWLSVALRPQSPPPSDFQVYSDASPQSHPDNRNGSAEETHAGEQSPPSQGGAVQVPIANTELAVQVNMALVDSNDYPALQAPAIAQDALKTVSQQQTLASKGERSSFKNYSSDSEYSVSSCKSDPDDAVEVPPGFVRDRLNGKLRRRMKMDDFPNQTSWYSREWDTWRKKPRSKRESINGYETDDSPLGFDEFESARDERSKSAGKYRRL